MTVLIGTPTPPVAGRRNKMTKISYTFAEDCAIAELRGVTVTGGEFCRIDGKYIGTPDAVRFATQVNGKGVIAKIAGKPELEAVLAEHLATKQAVTDRLAAIGWPVYQAAQSNAINARGAYDAASEYGYPVKQARAMREADEALDACAAQYPLAAMYAKAENYSFASNYAKAAAGRRAMQAIEQGSDPRTVVATMEAEWSAAAERAVDNS